MGHDVAIAGHPEGPDVPACPRCGYDLSGEVRRWVDACPLTGQCPECGLEIAWRDVLNPSLERVKWFYEHAPESWRSRAIAAGFTWLRAVLWPPVFWTWIRLHHVIAKRRLARFVAIMAIAVYAMAGILRAGSTALSQGPASPRVLPTLLFPWTASLGGWGDDTGYDGIAFIACWLVAMGTVFIALPQTMSRYRVRDIHLLRGLVYALAILPALVAVQELALFYLEWKFMRTQGRWGGMGWSEINWVVSSPEFSLFVGVIWGLLYWWAFTRRYLRLPHAVGIVACAAIIGFLIVLLGLVSLLWLSYH